MSNADEAESVRFARRRLDAQLSVGAPARGMVASLVLAIVIATGFAVLDAVHAPTSPPQLSDGTAVVTAQGEVYVMEEGIAYPTANLVSALLVSDRTISVTVADLAGVPRGRPRGIPGAPYALPRATELVGATWQLCTENAARISIGFGAAGYLSPASTETVVIDDGTAAWEVRDGARVPAATGSDYAIQTIPELAALIPLGSSPSSATPSSFGGGGTVVCAQSDPAAPFARPSAAATQRAREASHWVSVPTARGTVDLAMRPGSGVLGHRGDDGYWLITSAGELAPIADQGALHKLGYADAQAVLIPPEIISLLPPGPELSIEAARRSS